MRLPGLLLCFALLDAVDARAEEKAGAFCNVTPCLPGPVTNRMLTQDEVVGKVTCKKGRELGVDKQKRVVYCTTAKAVTVDGLDVAADAYTLFHPNGRIYQTHVSKPFERTLADGSKVSCAKDLIAQDPDGVLTYCKLGAKRAGRPQAKVGDGIAFHRSGRVAGLTLDEPFSAAGLSIPATSSVRFDEQGRLRGGWLPMAISASGLSIRYDFELHPNGKARVVDLAAPAKVAGHEFPESAKLTFRDDGSLEDAEYVAKRGFMIHGEEWTDTRHMSFDRSGKITADNTDHYQSDVRPPKFRK